MKSTYAQRVAAAKERAEQERAAAIQVRRQDALVAARLVAEGWNKA